MISEREKNAADMTVEEFAQHIKMLSDEVINFKDYFNPKDKRSNPRGTRTYMNSKRGNFHGASQWLSLNYRRDTNHLFADLQQSYDLYIQ